MRYNDVIDLDDTHEAARPARRRLAELILEAHMRDPQADQRRQGGQS